MARECSQLKQGQNREQSPPLSGLVYINCSSSSTPQPETHGGRYHTTKAENNRTPYTHTGTILYLPVRKTLLDLLNSPEWAFNFNTMSQQLSWGNFRICKWHVFIYSKDNNKSIGLNVLIFQFLPNIQKRYLAVKRRTYVMHFTYR